MQIHKRFTTEQVKAMLKGYCQGTLERSTLEDILGINKTRFFALLEQYRNDQNKFSITYQRTAHKKLPPSVEKKIGIELMIEKRLIEDPTLPITTYNYSAIRDRLMMQGIEVSLPTIIDRAKGFLLLPVSSKKEGARP